MEEVSLQEMLAARERRCYLQTQLLHQYKKSLISFTLENRDTVKRPSGSYSAYGNHKRKDRI